MFGERNALAIDDLRVFCGRELGEMMYELSGHYPFDLYVLRRKTLCPRASGN
jgi:hypothetical protein